MRLVDPCFNLPCSLPLPSGVEREEDRRIVRGKIRGKDLVASAVVAVEIRVRNMIQGAQNFTCKLFVLFLVSPK